MAIEFRCPQGHRLSCPEERAGKIGKCPKCNSTFVVPSAEVAAAVGAANLSGVGIAVADSGAMPTGQVAAAPGENAAAAAAPPGDVIVFLCPNGHKLNCPPSLQGKAGKCPHCGARFVIPRDDDAPVEEDYVADDEAVEEDEVDDVDGHDLDEDHDSEHDEHDEDGEDDAHDYPDDEAEAALPGASDLPADFLERLTGSGVQAAAPPQAIVGSQPLLPPPSALVEAFEELWQHRARGLVVQLHLRSGAVLAPDRYSFENSTDRYAIFAFKDADGLFSVSAVAWDQVERVSVQGMKFLPDELFH